MKTLRSLLLLGSLAWLAGCASNPDTGRSDLSGEVRASYRELRAPVPAGYQNDSERRNAYPGGTSASEWKSLTSSSR